MDNASYADVETVYNAIITSTVLSLVKGRKTTWSCYASAAMNWRIAARWQEIGLGSI
nr:hypothetical protein [Brevibacillus sp. HB1.4B]